jgi:DNA-directed RNA polymerase specialized sigma24 family protein
MRLVFNLTFREIAAEKGATVDSVKGKYRRAIKKYKKTLD